MHYASESAPSCHTFYWTLSIKDIMLQIASLCIGGYLKAPCNSACKQLSTEVQSGTGKALTMSISPLRGLSLLIVKSLACASYFSYAALHQCTLVEAYACFELAPGCKTAACCTARPNPSICACILWRSAAMSTHWISLMPGAQPKLALLWLSKCRSAILLSDVAAQR